MIVISCALDSSLAEAKVRGTLEAHRDRYKIFNNFDNVVLLTQDSNEFNNKLKPVKHVPCAISGFKVMEKVISRLKLLRWSYFSASSFVWLLRHRNQIDLVIAENVDSPTPFLFCSTFKKPYLIHYHYDVATQVSKINNENLQGILLTFLERLCFKRASCVWVTAENLGEKVKSYGANKVSVIPNWIDFKIEPKCQLNEQKRAVSKILFVGRLHPVKRVDLIIQAFKKLKTVCSNVTLIIIGDGEEKQNLVNLTKKLGLEQTVQFLGFQAHDTTLRIMKESDLFVLASKMEGNPRVLVEAMVLKIPIVATDVPGIKDMVKHGETGYLIKSPNPDEFAEGMRFVLENSSYAQRIAENAYVFSLENFSKHRIFEKIKTDIILMVPHYRDAFLS
jgi:glycosyltransferase involved in cell wall biosynthesis